jgi:hypothetical protein
LNGLRFLKQNFDLHFIVEKNVVGKENFVKNGWETYIIVKRPYSTLSKRKFGTKLIYGEISVRLSKVGCGVMIKLCSIVPINFFLYYDDIPSF